MRYSAYLLSRMAPKYGPVWVPASIVAWLRVDARVREADISDKWNVTVCINIKIRSSALTTDGGGNRGGSGSGGHHLRQQDFVIFPHDNGRFYWCERYILLQQGYILFVNACEKSDFRVSLFSKLASIL